MAPKPNAKQIDKIIRSSYYNYFGLRAQTMNPITNKFNLLSVGQLAPNSYDWDDGETTDRELSGTSALAIDRDAETDDIRQIVDSISVYDDRAQIVLLGCDYAEFGNDAGEIIMRNAEVLAEWKQTS